MESITHQIRLQQWAKVYQEWQGSGLNKTEWCRQNGISDKKFFYWQKLLRREAYECVANSDNTGVIVPVSAQPPATPFVQVKLDTPVTDPVITSVFHPDAVIQTNGLVYLSIENSVKRPLKIQSFSPRG